MFVNYQLNLIVQILVLLRQLNEKEMKYHGENTNELTERFRIYDDQLGKFELLREELLQKDKLISDLQTVVNNGANRLKLNRSHSPVTPVC